MYFAPVPDLAGLGFGGGAAKQQLFQGGAVKGKQRPEIAHAAEGGSGGNRK